MCNPTLRPDMICVVNRAANSAFWASGQKGPLKKQHVPEQQKTPVRLPYTPNGGAGQSVTASNRITCSLLLSESNKDQDPYGY